MALGSLHHLVPQPLKSVMHTSLLFHCVLAPLPSFLNLRRAGFAPSSGPLGSSLSFYGRIRHSTLVSWSPGLHLELNSDTPSLEVCTATSHHTSYPAHSHSFPSPALFSTEDLSFPKVITHLCLSPLNNVSFLCPGQRTILRT